jgi:hypothetical protein
MVNNPNKNKVSNGNTVVIYLQNPREKVWGQLCDISTAGISVYGIDLAAFEDWMRSLSTGENGIGLTSTFIPMWRVERIILDRSVGGIPGLEDQVINRTGLSLGQLIEQSDNFFSESAEISDFEEHQN